MLVNTIFIISEGEGQRYYAFLIIAFVNKSCAFENKSCVFEDKSCVFENKSCVFEDKSCVFVNNAGCNL